ncbi:MAG: formimidoylglutamase [Maribacter sp.]|nr:formimidoylglutamase [Maribacter sp.]
MAIYKKPNSNIWTGRSSDHQLYLYEKVDCSTSVKTSVPAIALLGYSCGAGVQRNHGRIGTQAGPDTIKTCIGKMPNHLHPKMQFLDFGTIECNDSDMEAAQNMLSQKTTQLLGRNAFPILLGGGHDIAYGHYNGIRNHIGNDKTIGIINFDAHFDLRPNENGNNSGTPFFQIAQDCMANNRAFNYLCLGIRKDANDRISFKTANDLGVEFMEHDVFKVLYLENVLKTIDRFISDVDYIYTSIDLDGFSSAYAPGVSSPSPMGYSPDIVLESLKTIINSKKLISIDVAEMNPTYDIDNQTAKLAASLVHFVMHRIE